MAIDGQGTTAAERTPPARTVAEVDLRLAASAVSSGRPASALLWDALEELGHSVRPGDRICPFSVSRIAVELDRAGRAPSPGQLGARLAQAVGEGLLAKRPRELDPSPAEPRTDPAAVPATVVTVEQVLYDPAADRSSPRARHVRRRPAPPPAGAARAVSPRRRRRAVARYAPRANSAAGAEGSADAAPATAGRRREPATMAGPAVVVLDGDPRCQPGEPGIVALAATEAARGLGFLARAAVACEEEALVVEVEGRPLDLVVLVVGPEPGPPGTWSSSTWTFPAGLTDAYRSKGIPVVALSAGASLAAMTTVVESGAAAAYDLSGLRRRWAEAMAGASGRAGRPAGDPECGPGTELPKGAEGFALLTGAERRVLFELSTGRPPQEVADDLGVSLATVRSHIRSVLRKLGVRSQLAAVALATSRAAAPDANARRPHGRGRPRRSAARQASAPADPPA